MYTAWNRCTPPPLDLFFMGMLGSIDVQIYLVGRGFSKEESFLYVNKPPYTDVIIEESLCFC